MNNDVKFVSAPLCKYNKRYIFSIIIFILIIVFGFSLTFIWINDNSFCCGDEYAVKMILFFFIIFFSFIVSRCICINGNKTEDINYLYEEHNYYNE